jgi:preprotein translocase subunit YajC
LIYVVVIGAVMIFMTSRGRKKQQAQQLSMRSALALGVEARTIGGLVGEVVELTDEHVVIETTPGVKLKFVKTAIAGIVPPLADDYAEDTETEGEDSAEETDDLDAALESADVDGTENGQADGEVHDSVVAAAEKVVEDAAAESTESTKK